MSKLSPLSRFGCIIYSFRKEGKEKSSINQIETVHYSKL